MTEIVRYMFLGILALLQISFLFSVGYLIGLIIMEAN